MNSSDLKLAIMRQVDSLGDDMLVEVINYIQDKVNKENALVINSLTLEERNEILKAQQSIKAGLGIPHEEIARKYLQ
jgi:precorrin-6B methylase 2